TRDTAQSVVVQAGEEVSGIDIRYRGERGHAVSGKILGPPAESANLNYSLQLFNVASRAVEAQTYTGTNFTGSSDGGFAFYGVPDGEYVIEATINPFDAKQSGGAGRTRVKVKGADVTGAAVTVVPYGAITGTLMIEPPRGADGQDKCEVKRRLLPNEMLVRARAEKKAGELDLPPLAIQQSAPSDKG